MELEDLKELRQRWAAEQPSREALLQETGEAERGLAIRERACGEALARQIEGELQGALGPSDTFFFEAFPKDFGSFQLFSMVSCGACEPSAMRPRP